MATTPFQDFFSKHSGIEHPPVVGWRLDPVELYSIKNQLIRHKYRWDPLSSERTGQGPTAQAQRAWRATATKEEDRNGARQQREKLAALRALFEQHAKKWRSETEHLSSVHQMVLHPSYQRIIGMGDDVVPLLIDELKKNPDHWFWALHAITGATPVPEADRGRIKKMADHWINWAKSVGRA